jgi:hypothetical protein
MLEYLQEEGNAERDTERNSPLVLIPEVDDE